MNSIEYLSKIEPVIKLQFDSIIAAEIVMCNERRYLEPELEYYKFEIDRWSNLEDFDDFRIQHMHTRLGKAYQALCLTDIACSAAASAIFQIAKQCVSMAFSGQDRFSKGRSVGSQSLSAVIWHTRNHALHFEEGWPPTKDVTKKSLQLLQKDKGLNLKVLDSTKKSLAYEILKILGWRSYELFAKDMVDLLQAS